MENNYQALFNCKFITNEDGVALFIDGKYVGSTNDRNEFFDEQFNKYYLKFGKKHKKPMTESRRWKCERNKLINEHSKLLREQFNKKYCEFDNFGNYTGGYIPIEKGRNFPLEFEW